MLESFEGRAGRRHILNQIPVELLQLPHHAHVLQFQPPQSYSPEHPGQRPPRLLTPEADRRQFAPTEQDSLADHPPIRVEEGHVLVLELTIYGHVNVNVNVNVNVEKRTR